MSARPDVTKGDYSIYLDAWLNICQYFPADNSMYHTTLNSVVSLKISTFALE